MSAFPRCTNEQIGWLEAELLNKLPHNANCVVVHEPDAAAFELRAWMTPLFDVNQVRRVSLPYVDAMHDHKRLDAIVRLAAALFRPLNATDKRLVGQQNNV